jgi:hypothetical protein
MIHAWQSTSQRDRRDLDTLGRGDHGGRQRCRSNLPEAITQGETIEQALIEAETAWRKLSQLALTTSRIFRRRRQLNAVSGW